MSTKELIEMSTREYYGDAYYSNYDFMAIVECILERAFDYETINDETLGDCIFDAINDELIYYHDQWIVLQFYCTPQEADFQDALEILANDCFQIANDVLKEIQQ